jgi:hypothetical protein
MVSHFEAIHKEVIPNYLPLILRYLRMSGNPATA